MNGREMRAFVVRARFETEAPSLHDLLRSPLGRENVVVESVCSFTSPCNKKSEREDKNCTRIRRSLPIKPCVMPSYAASSSQKNSRQEEKQRFQLFFEALNSVNKNNNQVSLALLKQVGVPSYS